MNNYQEIIVILVQGLASDMEGLGSRTVVVYSFHLRS